MERSQYFDMIENAELVLAAVSVARKDSQNLETRKVAIAHIHIETAILFLKDAIMQTSWPQEDE